MTQGADARSFPPQRRLRDRRAFDAVFKHPSHRLTTPGFLVLARENTCRYSRLGMIISKRTTPTAVKRNMIKRIIREAFRRSALSQRHFDVVVLLRGPVNLLDRPDIHLHINRLFGQLVDKEPR